MNPLPPVPGIDQPTDLMFRLRQVARDNPDWNIGYEPQMSAWHAYQFVPNGSDDHFRRDLAELLDLVEAKVAAAKKARQETEAAEP